MSTDKNDLPSVSFGRMILNKRKLEVAAVVLIAAMALIDNFTNFFGGYGR